MLLHVLCHLKAIVHCFSSPCLLFVHCAFFNNEHLSHTFTIEFFSKAQDGKSNMLNCSEVLAVFFSSLFAKQATLSALTGSAITTNSTTWRYVYTIERESFTVPTDGVSTVACLANATTSALPTVTSNCGETLTPAQPVITDNPSSLTCEGSRSEYFRGVLLQFGGNLRGCEK